jgi:hypothetical protein
MVKRIIEEISTFLEALFNQIPVINQRNLMAHEKQRMRTIHIWRTASSDILPSNYHTFPCSIDIISDEEFNHCLNTYFSKKLYKSMTVAATDFVYSKKLLPKIEEYYAR